MNFSLTDDQVLIRDSADSLLTDASTSAAIRAAMESAAGFDETLWQKIGTELGWCGTAIPEAFGGLGLGPVELMLIQEQAGRRLLCSPFFSTVCVAGSLLSEVATGDARTKYLPRIASGELTATAPLGTDAAGWPIAAVASPLGRPWQLDGAGIRMPDALSAEVLLVLARIGDNGTGLFAVPRGARGVTITPLETWDSTRRFADVELHGVQLPSEARIDDPTRAEGVARSADLARLYIAAEQLGGAQQCLDMTVAYVGGRKQFGRAVGSFQAVKHRCAEMMVRIEGLRSAVYGAAASTESMDIAAARMLAADTFFFCAQEAIQLHGGVGFTWEYDPQLFFKRAQASSHWLGSAEALRQRIGAALVA